MHVLILQRVNLKNEMGNRNLIRKAELHKHKMEVASSTNTYLLTIHHQPQFL